MRMPSAGPLPVPVGQCTGHFLAFQGALGENGMEMIPASTHRLKGPYTMFAGAGLGLLLILCLHRYPGINHDAILYLAPVSYTHLDVYKRQMQSGVDGVRYQMVSIRAFLRFALVGGFFALVNVLLLALLVSCLLYTSRCV